MWLAIHTRFSFFLTYTSAELSNISRASLGGKKTKKAARNAIILTFSPYTICFFWCSYFLSIVGLRFHPDGAFKCLLYCVLKPLVESCL